jgi:hypothetical protein
VTIHNPVKDVESSIETHKGHPSDRSTEKFEIHVVNGAKEHANVSDAIEYLFSEQV